MFLTMFLMGGYFIGNLNDVWVAMRIFQTPHIREVYRQKTNVYIIAAC